MSGGGPRRELKSQLDASMSSPVLNDGVPDTIVLCEGTFTTADVFRFGPGSDPVELRGQGMAKTTLTSSSTTDGSVLDAVADTHAVTVRDLRVHAPATFLDGYATEVVRVEGALERVRVTSANPRTDGIEAHGTTPLRAVEVDAPGGFGGRERRRLTIRARHPRGARVATITVKVAGRAPVVRRGRRATAPVDLRGMPKGRFAVKVTVALTDGRRLSATRRYRTCAPR